MNVFRSILLELRSFIIPPLSCDCASLYDFELGVEIFLYQCFYVLPYYLDISAKVHSLFFVGGRRPVDGFSLPAPSGAQLIETQHFKTLSMGKISYRQRLNLLCVKQLSPTP